LFRKLHGVPMLAKKSSARNCNRIDTHRAELFRPRKSIEHSLGVRRGGSLCRTRCDRRDDNEVDQHLSAI
jgi:hypothetical protein